MVNTIESALRQLKDMQVNTDGWDPMIIYLLLSRLPYRTKSEWEQKRKANEEPTLEALLAFLSSRARSRLCNEPATDGPKADSHSGQPRQMPDNKNPPKAMAINSNAQGKNMKRSSPSKNKGPAGKKPRFNSSGSKDHKEQKGHKPVFGDRPKIVCKLCQGGHPLYRCEKFKEITLNKKVQLVDQWHLCRVCLTSHGNGECKLKGCLRCGENHNVILCPTSTAQVSVLTHESKAEPSLA